MALRWIEGFNSADGATNHGRLYDVQSGGPGTQEGAYDGSNLFNGSWKDDDLVMRTPTLVGATQNTWVIGFAMRVDFTTMFTGAPGGGFRLRNTDGEQVRLEFVEYTPATTKPGGSGYFQIRVMRGAVELARTNEVFENKFGAEAGWHYFEWKVTIDNATGSFELRYNKRESSVQGFQTATWDAANTNVDTQEQTSTGADVVEISWESTASRFLVYDDIYILDSTGAAPDNDYLDGVIIEPLTAQAGGNQEDWVVVDAASTEDAWNDGATSFDDNDRVTSDTTGDISLVTVGTLGNIQEQIVGVRVDHVSRMESATGSLTLHFRYRKTTGTPAETDGGNYTVSSTTNTGHTDIQRTDPNTASAWVKADVDAMEVGVRNGG